MRSTSTALVNAIIEKFGSVRKPKCASPDSGESDGASTTGEIASRFIGGSAVLRRRRPAHLHDAAQARQQRRPRCTRRAAEAFRNAVENDRKHHHREAAFKTKSDIKPLNTRHHVVAETARADHRVD